MDYKREGLKARKSWFMFNDVIVCLGSGINSSEGLPVTTSVNQSYKNGEAIINTSDVEDTVVEQQRLTNPDWILHDNVGYMFPEGGTLKLETKKVEGSWNRVALRYPDEKITDQIFKLWFEHGINPNNRSYEYVLVPNADRALMESMEHQLPFEIKNWKNRQEVISTSGEIMGIVFYESGISEAFGGIEADRPCVIMLKKQADDLHLSVADPTQLMEEVNITFGRKLSGENVKIQNGQTRVKIQLPGDNEAGKTTTVKLTSK
jgi:chondroitin AC lyase